MGGVGPPPASRVSDLGGLLLKLFAGEYCRFGPSSHGILARTLVSYVFSCLLRGCVPIWMKDNQCLYQLHLGEKRTHCVRAPSGDVLCHGGRHSSGHLFCFVFIVLLY